MLLRGSAARFESESRRRSGADRVADSRLGGPASPEAVDPQKSVTDRIMPVWMSPPIFQDAGIRMPERASKNRTLSRAEERIVRLPREILKVDSPVSRKDVESRGAAGT